MNKREFWDKMEDIHSESWKRVGSDLGSLVRPKMIDEVLKGGFKKGEFINLFSYTGKGTSYLDITHPNLEENCPTCELIETGGMFFDAECTKHSKQ